MKIAVAFVLSLVIGIGAGQVANAQDPYLDLIEPMELDDFGQAVEEIKKYIGELPKESFRKKENAHNWKKALSNKFDAFYAKYAIALYEEALKKTEKRHHVQNGRLP